LTVTCGVAQTKNAITNVLFIETAFFLEIDESKFGKGSIIAVSVLTASGSSAELKETVHCQSAFFRLCQTDLLPPLFP